MSVWRILFGPPLWMVEMQRSRAELAEMGKCIHAQIKLMEELQAEAKSECGVTPSMFKPLP